MVRRGIIIIVYFFFLLFKNFVDFIFRIGGLLFYGIRYLWGVVGDLWNISSYESYIKFKSYWKIGKFV